MLLKFSKFIMALVLISMTITCYGQRKEISTWSAKIGLGFNSPSEGGFIDGFPAQSLNFPTVNLGVQRMFSRQLGARLDYGFNRFKSESDNPEFKVNYNRFNLQLVYNPSESLNFLTQEMQLIGHVGPGYSSATPLGNLDDNKQSFLNAMAGVEFHYSINRKVALYADVSYIYAFGSIKDVNPQTFGLGAFNGGVFNLTFGVNIALSGCYYCE